ncbi:MAG: small ribosomal subunit Rsm22 family protein [Termitinemataceae bacterium]|nr:MAG: small ribosomal subunit Rsm22 family protein [Termitinemataceae bacterium]
MTIKKFNIIIPASSELSTQLDNLLNVIEETFPLERKYSRYLTRNIADLSALLTTDRSLRKGDYINSDAMMNAYLRYFLPWNVYRLCRLNLAELLNFTKLEYDQQLTINFIDIGSGPLTMIFAFYFAMPHLHDTQINFYCVDKNTKPMEAGKKLFYKLQEQTHKKTKWHITVIKASFGNKLTYMLKTAKTKLNVPKADIVSAVNVCNEIFWNINQADISTLDIAAKRDAQYLSSLTKENGKILVVEPGVPRCASFLSLLRTNFLQNNIEITAPCTHIEQCPQHGGRRGAKWCHFAFSTDGAPQKLLALSAEASLTKERAALSFLLAAKSSTKFGCKQEKPVTIKIPAAGTRLESCTPARITVRITSDIIKLNNGASGRYGCCKLGLVLVCDGSTRVPQQQHKVISLQIGSLIDVLVPQVLEKDRKSGAVIVGHL